MVKFKKAEGGIEMKDLRMRTMNCECGLMVNRDYNSAINIKNEGLRILKTA